MNDLFIKHASLKLIEGSPDTEPIVPRDLIAEQINRLCKTSERRRSGVYSITAFECASLMTALINKTATSDASLW